MTSTVHRTTSNRSRAFLLGAALVIAPLGPLAIAVVRAILPTYTDDDPATIAANVASHPGAQSAVVWLTYLALLTLPLGVAIVAALAIRVRPILGAIAAVVAWLGFMSLFFIVANDQVALLGPALGLPPEVVAASVDGVQSLPAVSLATTVFVVGHVLGTVLLGIALWGTLPRWAAVALAVSQPLHLFFAVIVPDHLLDGLAWVITAVCFGIAAVTYFRLGHTIRS